MRGARAKTENSENSRERVRITKRFVDSVRFVDLVAPGSGQTQCIIFDKDMGGFGLRVMASGVKSYVIQYRTTFGKQRRLTLGKSGKITAEEARGRAMKVVSLVRDGGDPIGQREAILRSPTVSQMLDRYIAEHLEQKNRLSTQRAIKWLIERHIRPAIGAEKVASVTGEDLAKLHRAHAGTPRQANHILAVLSKAFALAERWKMRPAASNPCRGIERFAEHGRERFLSASELTRLGTTLRMAEREGLPWIEAPGKFASKFAPKTRRTLVGRTTTAAIELLLFTGCRLSEVLMLRWNQVDLVEGVISFTDTDTKAGKPQRVMINGPLREVLVELQARAKGSPWVLPSIRTPQRHLSKGALETAWHRLRTAAGLPDVRLHDLRHTTGTHAGQTGANAFMVRDLLRHENISMTGRYVNRADDALRALSEKTAERISAGLDGREAADTVHTKKRT